ncbi:MarR family transcriptional regulator [Lutimaribacter sp. EGI FJ00015]|uniref:MarR family transcriptional regulator n=1 Tax=Lutimaribacter degradans TaxID=2945989 RepID=A0ACC5ZXV9_9RHOB|nr:MarR family transcriptional regulator [Lutimaribacter sp. EGI FJ00013]MCM2563038.1 MarR family transcriptional regulator [Lutimaribacter sp. EGI FJ00013]MCO0614217.1 MarR family transcriptional regulator [Lutimaribacter sp. EGI FJ00015]MCO0637027.1 MarR family transcriptional regulator [Lutimaribacter sp. EGI FJ00014]
MNDLPDSPFAAGLDAGLREFVGYTMKRATSAVTADAARVLEPMGLRITTFSALSVICHSPGVRQTELAAALGMERSNSVAVIDKLEKAGWIARERKSTDRRAIALRPTTVGLARQKQARLALLAHEDRLFAGLTAAERRDLVKLLSKIEV